MYAVVYPGSAFALAFAIMMLTTGSSCDDRSNQLFFCHDFAQLHQAISPNKMIILLAITK